VPLSPFVSGYMAGYTGGRKGGDIRRVCGVRVSGHHDAYSPRMGHIPWPLPLFSFIVFVCQQIGRGERILILCFFVHARHRFVLARVRVLEPDRDREFGF
jgi:hypothetical protein